MRQGLITLVLLTAPMLSRAQGVITTVAGNGADASTGDGGPATSASFHPNGVTVDKAGNMYIADLAASVIRKVNTAGIISTVAGFPQEKTQFSGDGGPATSASIYISSNHIALAVDGAGNLYIADDGHHRIRKVSPSGIITTVAGNGKIDFSGDGGPATSASLYRPSGVALDSDGNIYIADTQNVRIRKVDTSGNISTVAGNGAIGYSGDGGLAVNAALFYPMGVAVDGAGNMYVADKNAYVVRKVNKVESSLRWRAMERLDSLAMAAQPPAPSCPVFTASLWTTPEIFTSQISEIIGSERWILRGRSARWPVMVGPLAPATEGRPTAPTCGQPTLRSMPRGTTTLRTLGITAFVRSH